MAAFIKVDKWAENTAIYGDIDGGFPLVVFDSEMENAVVLSPSSDFMSANQATFMNDKTREKTVTFGPLSSITEVYTSMLGSQKFSENSCDRFLRDVIPYSSKFSWPKNFVKRSKLAKVLIFVVKIL